MWWQRAVLVESDLRAFHPQQHNGVLGVVLGAVEGVHRAAGLVQVGARGLRLVGVLGVLPAARKRPYLGGTGVVVDGQEATRRHGGHEDHLPLFGVQAQRLDVDAGAHSVLEQRNLVDVDGQKVVLRQSDQRKRDAAVGAEHAWGDRCGHDSDLS